MAVTRPAPACIHPGAENQKKESKSAGILCTYAGEFKKSRGASDCDFLCQHRSLAPPQIPR